jgi:hypothetical protein
MCQGAVLKPGIGLSRSVKVLGRFLKNRPIARGLAGEPPHKDSTFRGDLAIPDQPFPENRNRQQPISIGDIPRLLNELPNFRR